MSTQPGRKVVVGVGELLWDLLPDGKQLGGAPTNFAYHAHALGAKAWVVSQVGKDRLGQEILERFQALGLPADLVTIDPLAPTGTVSVELSADGQPRFTIHEKVAWDNLPATQAAQQVIHRAEAVCFGSLAQRSPGTRATIRSLVAATPPQAVRVFDINLRQHFFSREIIAGWDLDEINRRANELAAYVCSQAGGTPPLPQHLMEGRADGHTRF